jgi:mannose/fructose-specific phosphotransferase system component IIA
VRTGIVVVSHGESGEAMVRAAEKVVGPLHVRAVTVPIGETREATTDHIEEACHELNSDELLFLVDLEGSTPFNVCQKRMGRCVVVSGVNMPMLFKLATVDRDRAAREVAEELAATGQKSIHIRGNGES